MVVEARQGPDLGEPLPPHSTKAEQCVLGSCLIDPEAFAIVAERLWANDFYHPKHRTIAEAMVRLAVRGAPTDYQLVSNELAAMGKLEEIGGDRYLGQLLQEVPTAIHVAHYTAIVQRDAFKRALISAAGRIAAKVWEGDDPMSAREWGISLLEEVGERYGVKRRHHPQAIPIPTLHGR